MPKKIYYIAGGITLLAIGLVAWHYIAAARAADDLDEAIQEATAATELPLFVQYGSVRIRPFAGDIVIEDANVVLRKRVHRFKKLLLDLSYIDFLRFYLGGAEYGLKHIRNGDLHFNEAAFIDLDNLAEVHSDSLQISYRGMLYDLLQGTVNGRPLLEQQSARLSGSNLRMVFPGEQAGGMRAESYSGSGSVAPENGAEPPGRSLQMLLSHITWTPSNAIQENFGFFMRGFGYETDQVPFDSLQAEFTLAGPDRIAPAGDSSRLSIALYGELFDATFKKQLPMGRESFLHTDTGETEIKLVDLSPEFIRVVTSARNMFNLDIPIQNEEIHLKMEGPLLNPSVRF